MNVRLKVSEDQSLFENIKELKKERPLTPAHPIVDAIDLNICLVHPEATAPKVMQVGDVAADVFSCEAVIVEARSRALVQTGVILELPPGFRARLRSRSGLSLKYGIEVGAGLIDNSHRKPFGVVLYNHSDDTFIVEVGDRIAQLCIERYTHPTFHVVDRIEEVGRSEGWGSSGISKKP